MKYRALSAAVGLAALLVAANAATADATAILDHLQNSPATCLDLSLARLGEMIDMHGVAGGYGGFADVEDNDIVIHAYSATAKPDEASCKHIVDRIKTAGRVDPKTGDPDDPASGYTLLFSYPGDDEFKIDRSYAQTVDSMFSIMVAIGETGDGKAMACQSRLLSNKITYQRQ